MIVLNNKENIRSFGRIKAKNITDYDNNLLNNFLPKHSMNIGDKLDKSRTNHLEVGFGYGESIVHRAQNNRNINYIGCEAYTKGVASLLDKIKTNRIENLKVFYGDARILIENLEDNSLDKIFILFPDPWPKKRHNKRRIISEEFLALISKKLKNNGELFFASDIINYVEWTIEKIENNKSFIAKFNNIEECLIEPEWWIETRYQAKAKEQGRKSYFLEYKLDKSYI